MDAIEEVRPLCRVRAVEIIEHKVTEEELDIA